LSFEDISTTWIKLRHRALNCPPRFARFIVSIMPLVVPEITKPLSNEPKKDDKDKKEEKPKAGTVEKTDEKKVTRPPKVDGRTAPGMEGMSDEAVRRFEEAMELEYQKREGGA
jgi:hypothetical protein